MKNFSFFYAAGTAGYVRGKQIADRLGAKKNPTTGFENDTCIYVKVIPPEDHPKKTYLDVDDAPRAAKWLLNHPEVGVIATCENSLNYLSKQLQRDDIVVIPHAHCNYERFVRPNRPRKTVGIIGSKTSFQYPIDDFREKLKEIGLELLYEPNYWETYQYNREKVCDFYKQIDIQVCWRPKMYAKPFKNPNKLVNAGSFGIPTVAYFEIGFFDWIGDFISDQSIEGMIRWLKELKENDNFYRAYATRALKQAEECHIDHIIEKYKKL